MYYNYIDLCLKDAVIFFDVCFNVDDATYAVAPIRQHQEVATLVKIHGMV